MNPFRSLAEYEEFIYTLPQRYPSVVSLTLVVVRRGATLAMVTGELLIAGGYRIVVQQHLAFADMPHPDDVSLASTFPHHKHLPPDIKHHRVPALGISFDEPNLPFLIEELERISSAQ